MKYKDTVISSFRLYPNLYPNRLGVDDHLFAVIGNGYEWVNGQLIEPEFNNYNPDTDEYDLVIPDSPDLEDYYPNISKEEEEKYNDYSSDTLAEHIGHGYFEFKIYGISEYSSLSEIPDDIQPDWLEAIEHFVNFCLENKDKVIDQKRDPEKQIERLEKAKQRILSLKK